MSNTYQNLQDFGGLRTNLPADKIPDRNASDCANIDFSLNGQIQTNKGKRLFSAEIEEIGINTSGFLYKKNYGDLLRVLLRVRDNGVKSVLEWFNTSNNNDNPDGKWEVLVDDLTTGAIMGFASFNNTNNNQLIFCNAVDNFSAWNGATATVASVTADTVVCNEDLRPENGFSATGDLIINGDTYAYTGITNKTFTGVTPDPSTAGVSAKMGVAQKPDTTTYSARPKGNILIVSAARLWLAGEATNPSTLYYSKVGDATNFTATTAPEAAGIEDFPDAGGAITLLDSKDNSRIVVFKEDGILLFRLDYTATEKIPYLDTLTLADDAGAVSLKAGTGIGQISFFVSRTEGLKSLQRALDGSDLNLDNISDIILPTMLNYDFSKAAAIYHAPKRCIKIACKSDSSKQYNDLVLSYYISRAPNMNFVIDISVDNDFVADWIADRGKLYALSSINQNTYLYFDQFSDDGQPIDHNWTSKEFTFGEPARGKEFNKVYVEGFIRPQTKIKITVLYGIMGAESSKTKILSWDDEYVQKQNISALGTEVIGVSSIGGSNLELRESRAFSVPIHFNINKSNRYKIKIETYYDSETSEESYWSVVNIATNPSMKGIDGNAIINSNI